MRSQVSVDATPRASRHYLDDALGNVVPLTVTPMTGGGSCEVFALDRGAAALGAPARAPPRQLRDRARRAARVPHPRRDQGRTRADRTTDRRLRRRNGLRCAVLRHGADRRAPHPAIGACRVGRPHRKPTVGPSRSSSTRWSRYTPSTGAPAGSPTSRTPATTSPARSRAGSAQLDSYGGRDLPAARPDRGLARRAPTT